jgi:phosphatidylinositol-3-phosphatase
MSKHLAARLVPTLGLLAAGLTAPVAVAPPAQAAGSVGHVWTIVLENSEFAQTFVAGRSTAPYLTQTLPSLGKLVVQYFGTGHSSLDNYIAMTSGQGPNATTQGDCDDPTTLGGANGQYHFDADGQAVDDSGANPIGCTYPVGVHNIADQFQAAGVSWKGYMENMDAQPGTRPACSNPFVSGTPTRVEANPDYKDKHNPWAYYHSTFDQDAYCQAHVVPLGYLDASGAPQGQLVTDLQSVSTTPQYSFLTPDQCHDGHDACASNGNNALAGADQFLKAFVPAIMASPAYQQDGLIVVVFDEGTSDLVCCGEEKAPNLSSTADNGYPIPGPIADGGGQTGAILLSPRIAAGSIDATNQFNHYSYLRSMEDLFGLPHLGYAAASGLKTFQDAGEWG